jgi:hypothetical protein
MCGGFANIACPGALVCIDDPSDSCDPRNGGADCSGLCVAIDGGATTVCGATSCAPGDVCLRQYSGVDGGGGPTPQRCVPVPGACKPEPTCSSCFAVDPCSTQCADVLFTVGGDRFVDCMGQ